MARPRARSSSSICTWPINWSRRRPKAVGADAELICWEFNEFGWSTWGPAWTGVGARGEDHLGSFKTAVAHTRKTLTMLAGGMDGLSHWCVGDMFYRSGLKQGIMYCGLWRYKWEGWIPRPAYFYYAALIEAFRPGNSLHPLTGLPANTSGLASRDRDGSMTIALLNHGTENVSVSIAVPGAIRRLRISPDHLPRRPDILDREKGSDELPLTDWQDIDAGTSVQHICISPEELTILKQRNKE